MRKALAFAALIIAASAHASTRTFTGKVTLVDGTLVPSGHLIVQPVEPAQSSTTGGMLALRPYTYTITSGLLTCSAACTITAPQSYSFSLYVTETVNGQARDRLAQQWGAAIPEGGTITMQDLYAASSVPLDVAADFLRAGQNANLLGSGTSPTCATAGYVLTASGTCTAAWAASSGGSGSGTITGVTAGTGLSGGGTSGSVTLNLANTAVTAGTYGSATTSPAIAVDAQGRITGATNTTITGVVPAAHSHAGTDVSSAVAEATHAASADSATTATNAGHATTADSATSATSATTATSAGSATTAGSAATLSAILGSSLGGTGQDSSGWSGVPKVTAGTWASGAAAADVGAAATSHAHAGEDVTSGTVADARIASTLLRKQTRTVYVDQGGLGDYTTIKGACDYVATQSPASATPWRISVSPGVFTESPFSVPGYTAVVSGVGSLVSSTTYQSQIQFTSQPVGGICITMGSGSSLTGFDIAVRGFVPSADITIISVTPGIYGSIFDSYVAMRMDSSHAVTGILASGAGLYLQRAFVELPYAGTTLTTIDLPAGGTLAAYYSIILEPGVASVSGTTIKGSSNYSFLYFCRLLFLDGTGATTYDLDAGATGQIRVLETPYRTSVGTITKLDRWRTTGSGLIEAAAADQIPVSVRGAASQSANLIEAQTSAPATVFSVSPIGTVTAPRADLQSLSINRVFFGSSDWQSAISNSSQVANQNITGLSYVANYTNVNTAGSTKSFYYLYGSRSYVYPSSAFAIDTTYAQDNAISLQSSNSGTVTWGVATQSRVQNAGSGVLTNAVAERLTVTNESTGSITNAYGLLVDDVSSGTGTNYAIKTGAGAVSLGGAVTIGGGTAIAKHLSATASLNYAQAGANSCEDLTITVTGAASGDTVGIGVPTALGAHNTTATMWGYVSAASTVTVRRCVISADGTDPAAATVRASVTQY